MGIATPLGEICNRCGTIHDPTFCNAHSKRQGGKQCIAFPMHEQTTCSTHGGRAPQTKALAHVAQTEKKMRQILGKLDIKAVENPLYELQMLAGEAKAWKEMLSAKVADLTTMRYSTDGGEAIRGEIILWERAIDRCTTTLAIIAKLNIDERMARLTELQVMQTIGAVKAGLTEVGMPAPQQQLAMATIARYLRPSAN